MNSCPQGGDDMRPLIVLLFIVFSSLTGPVFAEEHSHRRPDDIKQYLEHLDSSERDRYQKPAEVITALGLKPGMAVADLGAGSGYFTRRFVEAVTDTGIVYAVDVEPEMLAYAKESVIHMHIAYTAEFILARPDNPKLPFESVDLLFICNTLHHLENRSKYFSDLRSSLKQGARIAIIDFYPDERSGDLGFPKRHLVSRDAVIQELTAAGYRLSREHGFLPKQYFLEFVSAP
jgi:arsenite methyltransferase